MFHLLFCRDTDTNMSIQQGVQLYNPPVVYPLVTQQLLDNHTYIMYHGTTRLNAQSILTNGFFQSRDGMLGPGVYLSRDPLKALRYPINHPAWDRVVIPVQVNVGRVITINYQNHPMQKTWHQYGYDTAFVPSGCGMVWSGQEEDCVWDPRRIQILQLTYPTVLPAQPIYVPPCLTVNTNNL